MSKVKNIVILGVGYVLGAQAGRARYEQLKDQATRVAEHPRTRQLARTAREQVTTRLPGSVTERLPRSVSSRLGSASPAAPSSASVDDPEGVDHPEGSATIGRDVGAGTSAGVEREVVTDPAARTATRPSHL